jgi:hypothetical protein
MGFDRREPSGAPLPGTPGAAARAPGKQTLVEAALRRAGMQATLARGRQTVTPPAGDASAGGAGPAEPVQRKAQPDGATEPALEHEADELGAKVARGEPGHGPASAKTAATGTPAVPASHGPVQAKPVTETSDPAPPGAQPRMEELEGPAAADAPDIAGAAPIQMAPGRPKKKEFIPFKITVAKPMTREQFEAAANLQVFGSATVAGQWQNVKDFYTPDQSPVEVLFEASLVQRMRGAANAAKGIDTDASGKVAGAEAREKAFENQPASNERAALLTEIDRRYHLASGTAPDNKIAVNEPGKADLWRSIRDEVLFQHQYLANLPDKIKALIHTSIAGRDLSPADYDQLFRIAKKIEALPPGTAADYANKITGSTTDLSAFEAAIEGYRSELAGREQADTDRTAVQNKLLGLEEVYKLYRQYTATATAEALSPEAAVGTASAKKLGAKLQTADDLREQLEQQLPRYGFASIAEFATYIAKFEQAFEDGAVRITLDILAKYSGKLYRESRRYQDPAVVKDLHGKLAGFRTQHDEFDKNTKIYSEEVWAAGHDRDAEQRRLPGNGGMPAKPPTQRQRQAEQNIKAARANAEAEIKNLSKDHPIFAEDDLPADKRLDKVALAQASETQLAGVLQAHIADRNAVVVEARGQLAGKHELIYRMDKLMPAFYAEMDIQPGSIHDQIIKDKMHDDAIAKLVGGILLAIVAIALTVVSLGAATPAVIAAGASIGAAGLSTYMAYDEYQQYSADHAVADAGFADDPSVVWLVLAIVGAGVDMGAATKAVRALAPAAKALEAGGEVIDFTKAVEALQRSKQLDEKIAAAADKAAAARKSYAAAKGELSAALGKAYSLPGPLTDPEVYRALVKMAAAKIKEGAHSLAGFIAELKQARLAAKLGELTPEELAKAKQAWEDAERLAKLVNDPALLEKLLSKVTDAAKLERLLQVFPAAELKGIVDALSHADRLVSMIDHVGPESTGKMVRQWIADGDIAEANSFLERISAGVGKELAETAGVGAKSIIIDSNTAIALTKDADPALRLTMNDGEKARVAYIKALPSGTELRVGNVSVGETGGALKLKGVPIEVMRDSPDYAKVLNRVATENVGGPEGFADQALVADAFFARTEPGVTARFLTADKKVVNRLAAIAKIDVQKLGGYKALVKQYGSAGFNVTIEGRTITVIPVP